MKWGLFTVILGLLFVTLSSCARIKAMNTKSPQPVTEVPDEIRFRRVVFVLPEESELKARNVVLSTNSLGNMIMTYDDRQGTQSIELQKILSLKYSNTNFRYHGLVIGLFAGAITPYLFRPERPKRDPNSEIYGLESLPDKYDFAALIASPVCAVIGYLLGLKYYYNWQEYDLAKDPPAIHTIYHNRTIMIFRLTFPIR